MSWPDLTQIVRSSCLSLWGTSATLQAHSGYPPFQITGVIETPAMFEESFVPAHGDVYDVFDVVATPEGNSDGGATLKLRRSSGRAAGSNVIRFWVDIDNISPPPVIGDQITF